MESDVYAAFILRGLELDPQHITTSLGMLPSKTWRVGELLIEQAILRHKDNGWMIASDLPLSCDLQEHVKSVMERLQPGWQVLMELCTSYDAEINCVVKSYGGDRPAILFEKDIVKLAADLNAAINIDLYVLPRRRKSTRSANVNVPSTP